VPTLDEQLVRAHEQATLWREVAEDFKACLRDPSGLQAAMVKYRQARALKPVSVTWRCLDEIMPPVDDVSPAEIRKLEDDRRDAVRRALIAYKGNVSAAAKALGISWVTLRKLALELEEAEGILPLSETKRVEIARALECCGGDVPAVAHRLGIGRSSLYRIVHHDPELRALAVMQARGPRRGTKPRRV